MTPRISVIVPTYQRADLVGRAVASVLGQEYPDFEVLVVDDGSTDGTGEIARGWTDSRVRYLRQEHGGGGRARNRGAAEATGGFLTFLDSDDEARPGWLRAMAAALRPDTRLVFCGAEYVTAGGAVHRTALPDRLGPLFNGRAGLYTGGAFLVERALFEAVGGYADELPAGQHTELGFRLSDHLDEHGGGTELVPLPLLRYHGHGGAKVRTDSAAVLAGTRYLLRHHRERILRHPPTYVEYLSIAGTHAARLRLWPEARRLFLAALRQQPGARALGRLLLSLVPPAAARVWPPPAAAARPDGPA